MQKKKILITLLLFLLLSIFLTATAKNPNKKIVIAGSSSVYFWTNAAEDLKPHKVVNLGIRGSTAQQWNERYYKKIIKEKPDVVILYVGGNDFSSKKVKPNTIASHIKGIIAKIQRKYPKTLIYYVSINPTIQNFAAWSQRKQCNAIMRKYCAKTRKVIYINTSKYCLKNGSPNITLYRSDKIHLNQKGYTRIWKNVVAKKIKKQLK